MTSRHACVRDFVPNFDHHQVLAQFQRASVRLACLGDDVLLSRGRVGNV
jgi:hypothetical protein